tara:strand:- start:823 stop:1440 length:618 start_codon:yes stop_codon:yes gene_type:complete
MTNATPPQLAAKEMARHLLGGGAALLPTDTLPALAAAPDHAAQIWALKQRPQDKPLILMASQADQLLALTSEEARDDAEPLADRFWPGALTLVLPVTSRLSQNLNPGRATLGMRVPDCDVTRTLLSQSGPLATTSANASGAPSSRSAAEAGAAFPGLPLLSPLPWPVPSGLASTVIAWTSPGCWQVLRQGAVMVDVTETSPPCSG